MHFFKFILFLNACFYSAIGSFAIHDSEEVRIHVQKGEVVCRSVRIPTLTGRVIIKASVVGLTGNPNLFGGWDETEIKSRVQTSLAPVSSGGYHILSKVEDVPTGKESFFLCVTTFSTQGSDFLLTESIRDATDWFSSPISVLESFPVIWRLDGKGDSFSDFKLLVPANNERPLLFSVTPFFGEVDLRVFHCDAFPESLAASAVKGPDILSVNLPREIESSEVCVRVQTEHQEEAEFALSISLDAKGPFLAQSVPIFGSTGINRNFRVYVNDETDLSVILRSTASDVLSFRAESTSEEGSMWTSVDGRLEISKNSLRGIDVVYLSVSPSAQGNEDSFTLISTAHGTVEELQDGVPISVKIEGERRYRDFRVFVPKSVEFLVIQADSSKDGSGIGLFASDVRTSHDPRGYKWNSMKGTNEIVLSRKQIDIDGIIGCENCYIYISVKSCVVVNGMCSDSGELSEFTLSASTNEGVSVISNIVEKFFFADRKILKIPQHEEQNLYVYLTPHRQGALKYSLHLEQPLGEIEQVNEEQCVEKKNCVLKLEPNDPRKYLLVQNLDSNSKFADFQVAVRSESESILLRNHHTISVGSSSSRVDKFRFNVPKGENLHAIIRFDSPNDSIEMSLCDSSNGDCQSFSSSGFVSLNPATAYTVQVKSTCIEEAEYTIYPSFYSKVRNSLRIGFKPVSVLMNKGDEKISWQVGFSEQEEWLISASCDAVDSSYSVSLCVQDKAKARCCKAPCVEQGFGRQEVWLVQLNKDQEAVLVTLTTESLSHFTLNDSIDLKGRKSRIFRIENFFWPARIDLSSSESASVVYMIGSPEGEQLLSPPAQADVGSEDVYAKIDSDVGTATLISRRLLRMNEWLFDEKWTSPSFFADDQFMESFIRIERCGIGPSEKSINVNSISFFSNFLDIDQKKNFQDIHIFSSDIPFRVALLSGPVLSFEKNDKSFPGFLTLQISPKNAAGSLYRSLCYPNDPNASQCVLENSPRSIHGTPVACIPDELCLIPIPSECLGDNTMSSLSIVADKGPGFGIFSPTVEKSASYVSFGWLWFVAKIAIGFAIYRFLVSNMILIRIFLFRLIDRLRGKHCKFNSTEMDLIDGGYRMIKDPSVPVTRSRFPRPNSTNGTEMFSRSV